jgi:GTPase
MTKLPAVAIIGRPNVGKSTLFNRLVGRRIALVHDIPGVTRDRREAEAKIFGRPVRLVDTAGLEDANSGAIESRMRDQTDAAVADAVVIVFVIDIRAGITPDDKAFAQILRKTGKPIILVANKSESSNEAAPALAEAYRFGFGEPLAVSAEHGLGMPDLLTLISRHLPEEAEDEDDFDADDDRPDFADGEEPEITHEKQKGPIMLAIVGRPNAGKSTLVNTLLGEDRLLVGPEAGLTRDSISIDWTFEGREVRLVDTAGLRRKARVEGVLEKLAVHQTLETIRYANVVVLMVDASSPLDKQDLTIAQMVEREGRALVIAINKWDIVDDKTGTRRLVDDALQTSLAQMKGVPVVTLSALKGHNLPALMTTILKVYDTWGRRISTGSLNRWLEGMLDAHQPPLVDGRQLKIRYMTQVKARPPTFALFLSKATEVPESYLRYLANGLRETYSFWGVPLRFLTRKGKNPFDDK